MLQISLRFADPAILDLSETQFGKTSLTHDYDSLGENISYG
jgi:hypothetical protein